MSNTPTLKQLRRSYRAGAGPRVFAPVGVTLTLSTLAPIEQRSRFAFDVTCQECGHHVCSCDPKYIEPWWAGAQPYAFKREYMGGWLLNDAESDFEHSLRYMLGGRLIGKANQLQTSSKMRFLARRRMDDGSFMEREFATERDAAIWADRKERKGA